MPYYTGLAARTNDDIRAGFTWRLPERMNVGVEVCDRYAEEGRDLAIRWLGADGSARDIGFGELRALSNRAANALVGAGVTARDRVFTVLPRIPEHWVSLIGAQKLGAVTCCLSTTFGEDAIGVRIKDASPRVVLTLARHARRVEPAARAVGAELIIVDGGAPGRLADRLDASSDEFTPVERATADAAFLYYTSGTTGSPKGSVHGPAQLVGGLALMALAVDLRPEDVFWPTSDLAWVTGVLLTFGALAQGRPFVTYEGEFDAERWWRIIAGERVTNVFSAPTGYRMLRAADEIITREGLDVRLRHLATVGEPLDPDTLEWARRRLGIPIYECYGQTEHGGGLCTNRPGLEIRPGSLGVPLPYLTVAVVDGDGNEVPRGQEGEIVSRPDYPALFHGYWNRPEATAKVLRRGWHYTGDLAHMDDDGYVWFHARADDVITSAGYRIGPTEVEAALMSHPAVLEAAVVGKPDATRGQIVKAWVTLRAGFEAGDELVQELQAHCKSRAGGWNYPREVEFLPELPKTPTGKIRRVELRELDAARGGPRDVAG